MPRLCIMIIEMQSVRLRIGEDAPSHAFFGDA
jgi:hypothetical protein